MLFLPSEAISVFLTPTPIETLPTIPTLIDVASYGALGHVPPQLPTIYFFSVHLRAAQSLTAAIVLLPLQTKKLYSSAAAVVQSQLHEPYETNNFHVVLCPPAQEPNDATAASASCPVKFVTFDIITNLTNKSCTRSPVLRTL